MTQRAHARSRIAAAGLALALGAQLAVAAGASAALASGPAVSPATPAPLWLPVVLRNTCNPPVPPTSGAWLDLVNYYRALACLPAAAENPAWSDGARKHAGYMVAHDVVDDFESALMPGYTPEGAAAARASNLVGTSSPGTTDAQAIDLWMRGPFHAIGPLDPRLAQVGFGSARDTTGPIQLAAALNVISGTVGSAVPASARFPIRWPENGMTLPLSAYQGYEQPDPLASCPGYVAPSGPPILVQMGTGNAMWDPLESTCRHASLSIL